MAHYNVALEAHGRTSRTVVASGDESVLSAARRAGVDLPSLCELGWDIAYTAEVLEGSLDHEDACRYYQEDRCAGFALPCVAKQRSDVRVRTHQSAAMRRHRDAHRLPAPHGT